MSNEELKVYSTVAGELVDLVRMKKPMCFVPYAQAKALKDELEKLRKYRDIVERV